MRVIIVPVGKVVDDPLDFCNFPLYPRPVTDMHLSAWGRRRAIKLPLLSTVREGRPPRSSFIGAL
jgi:hypothetical protein